MTTISLPTSMRSVAILRAALTRSSQAGLTRTMLGDCALRRWLRLDNDFAVLAHRHQEPPPPPTMAGRGPPG